MVASGGALAPVMVAVGVIGGGIQLGKSAYKAATATTDDEARAAWQGLGTGTVAVVGSVAGAKGALKTAGIEAEGMNCLQATAKCITSTPSQVGKTVTTFTSGEAINNLKVLTGGKKKTETKADNNEPVKQENKPESKKPEGEAKPKQKSEVKTESEVKPQQQSEPQQQVQSQEIKTESQQEAKVELKQETRTQQTETGKPQVQEPKAEVKQNTQPEQVQAQEVQQQSGKTPETKPANENPVVENNNVVQQVQEQAPVVQSSEKHQIWQIDEASIEHGSKDNPWITVDENEYQDFHRFIDEFNQKVRKVDRGESLGDWNLLGKTFTEEEQLNYINSSCAEFDKMYQTATPTQKAMQVSRSVSSGAKLPDGTDLIDLLSNSKPGDIIIPDSGYGFAFVENDIQSAVQNSYITRQVNYEILIPEGAKIPRCSAKEVILPRNAQYEIVNVVPKDNGVIAYLKYILR